MYNSHVSVLIIALNSLLNQVEIKKHSEQCCYNLKILECFIRLRKHIDSII